MVQLRIVLHWSSHTGAEMIAQPRLVLWPSQRKKSTLILRPNRTSSCLVGVSCSCPFSVTQTTYTYHVPICQISRTVRIPSVAALWYRNSGTDSFLLGREWAARDEWTLDQGQKDVCTVAMGQPWTARQGSCTFFYLAIDTFSRSCMIDHKRLKRCGQNASWVLC